MNTEIDGKKYTMHEESNGEIRLVPVEEKHQWKVGDVYEAPRGNYAIVMADCTKAVPIGYYEEDDTTPFTPFDGYSRRFVFNIFDFANGDYVKKSDVIAALSQEDTWGDCVLSGRITVCSLAIKKTREALKELGIIQD